MQADSAQQFQPARAEEKLPVPPAGKFSIKRGLIITLVIFCLGIILIVLINFLGVLQLKDYFSFFSPVNKQIKTLDQVSSSVNTQKEHFDPKITLESWQSRQENIRILVDRAKEALSKGDAEAARQSLLSLKTQVVNSGEVLKMKRVPDELKQAHDPKDKYIKQELVDAAVLEEYLRVIDLLVSTDKDY